MAPVKAVIFDLGGVVVSSPLEAIRQYERGLCLPKDFLNIAMYSRGSSGAFQRFERGELTLAQFLPAFAADLNDHAYSVAQYAAFKKITFTLEDLPSPLVIDAQAVYSLMTGAAAVIDERMATAVSKLRESQKFKVVALTNNFAVAQSDMAPSEVLTQKRLRGMFDEYFESSVIGLRKPDIRIYTHVLNSLRVRAEECVFLDDIGANLKAAQGLGITTIS
ncbi:hypothetical protein HDU82_002955 [Entophlyctis luteolus]|nr:hypothetical protein HDU82_002955 [Entophlyctis luteolus]